MTAVVVQLSERRTARGSHPGPFATRTLCERGSNMFNNANPTVQAGRENLTIAAQDSPGRPSTSPYSNSTSSLRKPQLSVERRTLNVDVCTSKSEARTEEKKWGLDALFEQFHDREIEPVDVPLEIERIPERYHALRTLAEFVKFSFGLSLASFDFYDVPLSERYVAEKMGWLKKGKPDGARAWKSMQALVKYGVIAPGEPRRDISRAGRMCLTFRPPEPLATELGYERREPELHLVESQRAA